MSTSPATVQRRIEELLRIRLDGAEFWDVREYAREKEAEEGSNWFLAEGANPLSDGQLRRYLVRVDALVQESCRASRKKLFREHLAKRRNLYAKAVSQGDVRAALAMLDSEAKLLDLYPSAERELARTVEQLRRELASAQTKADHGPGDTASGDRQPPGTDPGHGGAPDAPAH